MKREEYIERRVDVKGGNVSLTIDEGKGENTVTLFSGGNFIVLGFLSDGAAKTVYEYLKVELEALAPDEFVYWKEKDMEGL